MTSDLTRTLTAYAERLRWSETAAAGSMRGNRSSAAKSSHASMAGSSHWALRPKRGCHSRPPTCRAAQGRRVELRGGERVRPFVGRYHNQRPGRPIGLRAGNRWLQGIHRGSAPGRGVPPRTKTAPTKEHRRDHQPAWQQFSFPTQWKYDVLRGLEYFRSVGE